MNKFRTLRTEREAETRTRPTHRDVFQHEDALTEGTNGRRVNCVYGGAHSFMRGKPNICSATQIEQKQVPNVLQLDPAQRQTDRRREVEEEVQHG